MTWAGAGVAGQRKDKAMMAYQIRGRGDTVSSDHGYVRSIGTALYFNENWLRASA